MSRISLELRKNREAKERNELLTLLVRVQRSYNTTTINNNNENNNNYDYYFN